MNTCAANFVAFLEEKNLHFDAREIDNGGAMVAFPYNGKLARIFFNGQDGSYMSMYLVYESVPAEKIPDMLVLCNELNAT